MHAVSIISQFLHKPKAPYYQAVEEILRNLKSCSGKVVCLLCMRNYILKPMLMLTGGISWRLEVHHRLSFFRRRKTLLRAKIKTGLFVRVQVQRQNI